MILLANALQLLLAGDVVSATILYTFFVCVKKCQEVAVHVKKFEQSCQNQLLESQLDHAKALKSLPKPCRTWLPETKRVKVVQTFLCTEELAVILSDSDQPASKMQV